MIRKLTILVFCVASGMAGCDKRPTPAKPLPPIVSTAALPASSAMEAAGNLDTRAPVPLLPMMAEHQKQQMRSHLSAVQEIVAALANNDFGSVEVATKKIGYSDSMAQMCTHMG